MPWDAQKCPFGEDATNDKQRTEVGKVEDQFERKKRKTKQDLVSGSFLCYGKAKELGEVAGAIGQEAKRN